MKMKKRLIFSFYFVINLVFLSSTITAAKSSSPILKWIAPLGDISANIIGFDSEGNLLVFHNGPGDIREVMTKFSPNGEVLLNSTGGFVLLDTDEFELCINGSDWIFVADLSCPAGYCHLDLYIFDNFFNKTVDGIHLDNLGYSYEGYFDIYCLSNKNYFYHFNYINAYNDSVHEVSWTGEAYIQKYYFEVILEDFYGFTDYALSGNMILNESFVPEGKAIHMFENNNNLVIVTTSELYILDAFNAVVKNHKSLDHEVDCCSALDNGVLISYWDSSPYNSDYIFEFYDYNCNRLWLKEFPLLYDEQNIWNIEANEKYFSFQRRENDENRDIFNYGIYVYNSKGILQTELFHNLAKYDFDTKGWFYYTDVMLSKETQFYCAMNNDSAESFSSIFAYSFVEISKTNGYSISLMGISLLLLYYIYRKNRKKYTKH